MTAPYKGKFEYCFINNDNVNTKDVTFNIHGVVYVDGDDENAKTLDGSVRKLARLIREVKDEQGYIVIRRGHIEILLSLLMTVSSGGPSSRLVLSLLTRCSRFST